MEEEKLISVLLVSPNTEAKIVEIEENLDSMQELLGGDELDEYMPFDDDVAIVLCRKNQNKMLPNRAIYNEKNEIIDIIFGKFCICFAPLMSEKYLSLPQDLAKKYCEKFRNPEHFFKTNGGIKVVPFVPNEASEER